MSARVGLPLRSQPWCSTSAATTLQPRRQQQRHPTACRGRAPNAARPLLRRAPLKLPWRAWTAAACLFGRMLLLCWVLWPMAAPSGAQLWLLRSGAFRGQGANADAVTQRSRASCSCRTHNYPGCAAAAPATRLRRARLQRRPRPAPLRRLQQRARLQRGVQPRAQARAPRRVPAPAGAASGHSRGSSRQRGGRPPPLNTTNYDVPFLSSIVADWLVSYNLQPVSYSAGGCHSVGGQEGEAGQANVRARGRQGEQEHGSAGARCGAARRGDNNPKEQRAAGAGSRERWYKGWGQEEQG